jgi:Arrestin (or S-antigen), C-terminal domain/Arrestin (or S-antigen), N-terminal domain
MNINFELDQTDQTVSAGGTLTGDMVLRVTESVRASNVSVQFEGKEYTTVQMKKDITRAANNYRKRVRKEAHGSHRILSAHLHVPGLDGIVRNGVIAPGTYELPFEFNLPTNLPPTLAVQQDNNTAAISYRLRAFVKEIDYETVHPIRVLASQVPIQTVPYVLDPQEDKIKNSASWFGGGKGKVYYGAKVMNTQFARGSSPQVKTSIINDSDVPVVGIKMAFRQVVDFSANEHRATITETLCSITFPQKELRRNSYTDRTKAKQNREKILEELQAFKGAAQDCWTLPAIPKRTLNTMKGGSIRITHDIVVTIQTESDYTNLTFEIPVTIVTGAPPTPPPPKRRVSPRASKRPSKRKPATKRPIPAETTPKPKESPPETSKNRRKSRMSFAPRVHANKEPPATCIG